MLEDLTVKLKVTGDAVFNLDYTAVGAISFTQTNATAVIPARAMFTRISCTALRPLEYQQQKTLTLTVLPVNGIYQVAQDKSTWVLTDDDLVVLAVAGGAYVRDNDFNLFEITGV